MNIKALLVVVAVLILAGMNVATPQQNISGSSAMTMVQGGNTAIVTASGAQKVDGSGVTQPVSGTVTANAGTGTMAVSGPLTDAQLRLAVSGPLTDAQLRASAVPVSGSFSSTPLTGCGATNYDSGIVTIPNSTTVLTATATCVTSITLINLTAAQQTCTVTDGSGTPLNLIPPSFDLQAKSDAVFNRNGVKALAGIKWSCTNATAVAGIVRGNQ